jgi:flagellin
MDLEFQQLKTEIDRIAETTKFNGLNVMNTSNGVDIQAGWETTANDVITINTKDLATDALSEFGPFDTATLAADSTVTGFDAAGDSIGIKVGEAALGAGNGTEFTFDYGEVVNGVAVTDAATLNQALAYSINNDSNLAINGITAEIDGSNVITLKSHKDDLAAGDFAAGTSVVDSALSTTDDTTAFTLGATAAVTDGYAGSLSTMDIATRGSATVSVNLIDEALTNINDYRADMGAIQNRMEYTVSNLSNVNENMQAARSQILDADFAKESANLARTQVLQQAGMSMLSQANQQSQNVLQLLQ